MEYKLKDTMSKDAFRYGYLVKKIAPFLKPHLPRIILNMILAVLEKKMGLSMMTQDVYVNIVGGIKPEGTYTDLAVALAVYSSYRGIHLGSQTIALGEIGLTGDLRAVQNSEKIVKEAARLGFERVIMPVRNAERLRKVLKDINNDRSINDQPAFRIIGIKNISEVRNLF